MPVAASADNHTDVIQVLGINDFHGRIQENAFGGEAGAAVLTGAVKELETQYPDTVFSAAGDLIGASTFESFIAQDKPTIDALNEAGLDVSAVGNHEFDQGLDDLLDRVMAPYDADDNPYGGAEWQYIGANVRYKASGDPAVPESWIKDFGTYQVGFVGAVTEHLDELVSPSGIEDIEVTDIVAATNDAAEDLITEEGADAVVLLVHEGAETTSEASATDPATDFGAIVNGVSADIDAIISGHTHLAYNHAIEVPEWVAEDRPVTERPVVSAGQYGVNLNQLLFHFDSSTEELVDIDQGILPLLGNYTADSATQDIVDAAVAEADVLGAEVIGEISAPFNRAVLASGSENRGGESTLGNLVAEVQQEQTSSESQGDAQIAFMNPGGLRADMLGDNDDGYPADLTFKQAANVQPFANTLVNMTLTGAQVKTALEQQWQPEGSSRPFLKLGISEGLTYTYDPAGAAGDRVTEILLDGVPVDPAAEYSVTVNSFLASGGDNFGVFADGTNRRDTGQTDLQAMVDYLADQPAAVAPDYTQRAVGVSFPADAPAAYAPGDEVALDVSSLSFSTAADQKDTQINVSLDGDPLGTFPVDNTVSDDVHDETGQAAVDVTLPATTPPGTAVLTITGATTGTVARVPVAVATAPKVASTIEVTDKPKKAKVNRTKVKLKIEVKAAGVTPTGTVTVDVEGATHTGTLNHKGKVNVTLPAFTTTGTKEAEVVYHGDNAVQQSIQTVTINATDK